MPNKFFLIGAFCFLFALSACGSNNNIFSWAHDKGGGDFNSLKADGAAAMKDNKYSEAAKYYKKALDKNPYDEECALQYSTAKLFGVISSQYGDVVKTFISDEGTSSEKLLGFLTGDTPKKVVDALKDSMGTAGNESGYLANAANQPGASTNLLLNAAAINVILSVAEVLSNTAPYVNQYLQLNADFSVNLNGIPSDPQEKQELLNIVEDLMKRAETSLDYLDRAPIANLPPDVDQSEILKTVRNYFNKFESELSQVRMQLI